MRSDVYAAARCLVDGQGVGAPSPRRCSDSEISALKGSTNFLKVLARDVGFWPQTMRFLRRLQAPTHSPYAIAIGPAVILSTYLAFSCWQIQLPGLQYDELLFANAALGHRDESFIAYELQLAGDRLPVMLMPYIGALKAYLYTPLFRWLPPDAATVRLPMILSGCLTLILTYFVVSQLAGHVPALVSCGLLATDPSFIFHTRVDFGPTALMMLFKMASLLAFVIGIQSGRKRWLALGAFLLGLGVFDKANFLWFVCALPVSAFVVWRKQARQYVTSKNCALALLFFLLGSLPLWYYNAFNRGATFKDPILIPPDFMTSAKARIGLLIETLNGSGAYKYFNGIKPSNWLEALTSVSPGTFTPWAILVVCLMAIAWRKWLSHSRTRKVAAFFGLLAAIILLEIVLTRLPIGWHHLMMLSPFYLIALSIILCEFVWLQSSGKPSGWVSTGGFRRTCSGLILFAMLASNAWVDLQYLRSLSRDGGRGFFSDAIYDLAAYGLHHPQQQWLLMDWGFSNQLLLLSKGAIRKSEVFWGMISDDDPEGQVKQLDRWAGVRDAVFVFHAPACTVYKNPREQFEAWLNRRNLGSETVRVFYHRRGDPAYILKRLVRP